VICLDTVLSSLCISKFDSHSTPSLFPYFALKCKLQVREATNHLLEQVIPEFAQDLIEFKVNPSNPEQLCSLFHKRGINMRHSGLLLKVIEKKLKGATRVRNRLISLIYTNMVTRYLKNRFRDELRQVVDKTNTAMFPIVANFFNRVFGRGPISDFVWIVEIAAGLAVKFGFSIADDTVVARDTYDLRTFVNPSQLFFDLQNSVGVRFKSSICLEFSANSLGAKFLCAVSFLTRLPLPYDRDRSDSQCLLFSHLLPPSL